MRKTYLAIMSQGDVLVATVEGEDEKHCEGLAVSNISGVHDDTLFHITEYSHVLSHGDGMVASLDVDALYP